MINRECLTVRGMGKRKFYNMIKLRFERDPRRCRLRRRDIIWRKREKMQKVICEKTGRDRVRDFYTFCFAGRPRVLQKFKDRSYTTPYMSINGFFIFIFLSVV